MAAVLLCKICSDLLTRFWVTPTCYFHNISTTDEKWLLEQHRNIYRSAAENAKCWVAQWTTHGWWLGGLSQFGVVRQSIICSEHEINWNVQKEAIGIRVLLRHKYKRTHDISESYVQFHSEIFSAKPKEFIGRQTDNRWWDLGSPDGFIGHIWWPGDHISAALLQSWKTLKTSHQMDIAKR